MRKMKRWRRGIILCILLTSLSVTSVAAAPSENELKEQKQKIFPVCRKVYCKDKQIALTQKEFDVFLYLAGQPGRVFTKEQILEAAGSEDSEDEDNAVWCLIAGIRKKLRKYTNKEYIQTVRGVGYRFMVPEE